MFKHELRTRESSEQLIVVALPGARDSYWNVNMNIIRQWTTTLDVY